MFLSRARSILSDVQRAAADSRATADGESGLVNIRFSESTSLQQLVPAVVTRFRKIHPKVDVHLTSVSAVDDLQDLQEGRFDAAYCTHVPPGRRLNSELLYSERIFLAIPARHALARKRIVRAIELDGEPFIGPPREITPPELREQLDEIQAKVARLKIVTEIVSSATRLNLVASEMGITFVTESAKSILPRNVALRPLADHRLEMHTFLAWRREDDSLPLLRSLRKVTQSMGAKFVGPITRK
jgi:DNA-binding transcriptional LysR family regulator